MVAEEHSGLPYHQSSALLLESPFLPERTQYHCSSAMKMYKVCWVGGTMKNNREKSRRKS